MKKLLVALICVATVANGQVHTPTGPAWEWGISVVGRTAAIAATKNIVQITCNSDWSLALTDEGELIAWGRNQEGQTNVPAGTFKDSFAGWRHGIAIKEDGTLEEWGTPFGETIPDWIAWRPNITNAKQVVAGDDHSACLTSNGVVYAWGGRAAVTNNSGVYSNAMMIASGWYHLMILHSNGTVTAFGQVSQPGQSFTVPASLAGVSFIAASQFASYAISNGFMVAWGMPDEFGQYTALHNATNLVSISGGRDHTIVARADGTVLAWGDNTWGQCSVPTGLTNSVFVASSRLHSQAISRITAPTTFNISVGNLRVRTFKPR